MVVLSHDVVLRRLQGISTAHDSIQTMALWIMHYKDKASVDVIVEGWLKAFQIAQTDNMRIALFYVMNDVVQKAKNKHIDILIPAFQPAVLTAVGIGKKSDKVKKVMERCIQIFGERNVFTAASVTSMQNLLEVEDVPDSEEIALDIDMHDVMKKIRDFLSARILVENIMKVMSSADLNYKAKVKHQMRDKKEGELVLNSAKDAINTVIEVRHTMEAHKKKMSELIESLELAKRVYSHQLKEVIVVEDAYKKFEMGIYDVHKELLAMEQSKNYPGSTPPRDAPSPTANDDIYATGVESYLQKNDDTADCLDDTRMDLDDGDEPVEYISASAPSLYTQHVASNPMQKLSLQSRMLELGLAKADAAATFQESVTASSSAEPIDFSRPPPGFNAQAHIDGDRDPRKKTQEPPATNVFNNIQKSDLQSILRNVSTMQQQQQKGDVDDRMRQYHASFGAGTAAPSTSEPQAYPETFGGEERVQNYPGYQQFQTAPDDYYHQQYDDRGFDGYNNDQDHRYHERNQRGGRFFNRGGSHRGGWNNDGGFRGRRGWNGGGGYNRRY